MYFYSSPLFALAHLFFVNSPKRIDYEIIFCGFFYGINSWDKAYVYVKLKLGWT